MENSRSMWTCYKRSKRLHRESYGKENEKEEDLPWVMITTVLSRSTLMMTIMDIKRMAVIVIPALPLTLAPAAMNQGTAKVQAE